MRLLMWHVDAFVADPTQRGRSPVADAEPRRVAVEEALVVFAATERTDEPEVEAVAARAAQAIAEVAGQVGARHIVLHSFAHLFVEHLSTPAAAQTILARVEELLAARDLQVEQSAFGWFNRLEMRAKGHPLSRVARQV